MRIYFSLRLEAAASLPVRGAWVEMILQVSCRFFPVSLPVRGAWVEIDYNRINAYESRSLPVRGAWVEIFCFLSRW